MGGALSLSNSLLLTYDVQKLCGVSRGRGCTPPGLTRPEIFRAVLFFRGRLNAALPDSDMGI